MQHFTRQAYDSVPTV